VSLIRREHEGGIHQHRAKHKNQTKFGFFLQLATEENHEAHQEDFSLRTVEVVETGETAKINTISCKSSQGSNRVFNHLRFKDLGPFAFLLIKRE